MSTRPPRASRVAIAVAAASLVSFARTTSVARAQAQPAAATAAPATKPTTAAAAAAIPKDQSTPKGALRVLADSMEAGDAQRIRGVLHASNAAEQKMAEGMVDLATALAELKTNAIGAFGKQGAMPLTDDTEAMAAAGLERLVAATETVDPSGDRATVTLPDAGEAPAVVVKVEGQWRFPVAELARGSSEAEVKDGIELAAGQAKVMREVAAEVKQGKYKTADEVRQALDQRVMQFVTARQAAATTRPGAAAPQPGGGGGGGAPPR
jgi:hypothetical protein